MTLEQLIEEKAFPTSQQPSAPMALRVDDVLALFDGKVLVPVDAASPARGIVTGVLPTKKNVEIALEHDAELPILGERVFISSESLFRGVGISGQGHNADWCAGWNACLLLSTKVEPCTYAAMLAASQEQPLAMNGDMPKVLVYEKTLREAVDVIEPLCQQQNLPAMLVSRAILAALASQEQGK